MELIDELKASFEREGVTVEDQRMVMLEGLAWALLQMEGRAKDAFDQLQHLSEIAGYKLRTKRE